MEGVVSEPFTRLCSVMSIAFGQGESVAKTDGVLGQVAGGYVTARTSSELAPIIGNWTKFWSVALLVRKLGY